MFSGYQKLYFAADASIYGQDYQGNNVELRQTSDIFWSGFEMGFKFRVNLIHCQGIYKLDL